MILSHELLRQVLLHKLLNIVANQIFHYNCSNWRIKTAIKTAFICPFEGIIIHEGRVCKNEWSLETIKSNILDLLVSLKYDLFKLSLWIVIIHLVVVRVLFNHVFKQNYVMWNRIIWLLRPLFSNCGSLIKLNHFLAWFVTIEDWHVKV